jgi:hypothetical protein
MSIKDRHRRLLRTRRERPCRRAADTRGEITPFQSIEWHPSPMSQDSDAEYQAGRYPSGA